MLYSQNTMRGALATENAVWQVGSTIFSIVESVVA